MPWEFESLSHPEEEESAGESRKTRLKDEGHRWRKSRDHGRYPDQRNRRIQVELGEPVSSLQLLTG